jgi:hypothetical protein
MSETFARTVAQARRRSETFLKTAVRWRRATPAAPAPEIEPANDTVDEAAPPAASSVIATRAEMTGTLSTPEELHVRGRVEGDLRAS